MQLDWTTIIVSIISALGAGGVLTTILNRRENKISKQLENDVTASRQWRELFEKEEKKCEEKDAKIDRLYDEISSLRNENNQLSTENVKLDMMKCKINGCIKRRPPRNWEQVDEPKSKN